jgi:CBS domain-containing protein
MKKREPISHIMTKTVVTVNQNDDLTKVVEKLKSNSIRHLPVVNGKKVVGIISRTDINRLTFGALFDGQEGSDEAILQMLTIPQVMTAKPKTVSSDAIIRDLAEIFSKEEFHALPVVDNDELKGIVTTTDVIKTKRLKKKGTF